MDLYINTIDADPLYQSLPVHVNGNGENHIITSRGTAVSRVPLKVISNYYEPRTYDRTIFLSAGLVSTSEAWFNNVSDYVESSRPTVYFSDSRLDDQKTLSEYPYGVEKGNNIYNIMTTHGEMFNFVITVPAYSNCIKFETTPYVVFSADPSWTISSFGAYIVDTAEPGALNAIQQLIVNTASIDANVGRMVEAINLILEQMRALNADTDTIITLLNSLVDLNERELTQLENISTSVDAIYYFLTQALKDEADELSQEAENVAGAIQNNGQAEEYYQTSMQGSYDSLDLDNFTFGGITGGMELVGRIFSDIWAAFGEYNVLFTYPLILGIALLVIGRLSKTGGGNSSRNSEHKGGEGGA